jgi:acetylornithine deacetylase/succinyl-diaminopimelate desuccinylase-like protein
MPHGTFPSPPHSLRPALPRRRGRLRAAGIPTYGVQGFFMDRDDIRFHGRDERLLVTSFYEGQQFLYTLVKDLCTTH